MLLYSIFADLAVGVVSECLVGLIKDDTADVEGGAGPVGKVILHDLWREEEDTPTLPQTNSLLRGKVT